MEEEIVAYITALEYAIASNAILTNPPARVAGLLSAMRHEFAPSIVECLEPLNQLMADATAILERPKEEVPG